MRVKVYQDPITREDFEGEAELIEEIGGFINDLKTCIVVFSDGRSLRGHEKFYRKVHREDFLNE